MKNIRKILFLILMLLIFITIGLFIFTYKEDINFKYYLDGLFIIIFLGIGGICPIFGINFIFSSIGFAITKEQPRFKINKKDILNIILLSFIISILVLYFYFVPIVISNFVSLKLNLNIFNNSRIFYILATIIGVLIMGYINYRFVYTYIFKQQHKKVSIITGLSIPILYFIVLIYMFILTLFGLY